jgi:hypothetical protein
MDPF